MIFRFTFWALCLSFFLLTRPAAAVDATPANDTVVYIQFLHRHGARMPEPLVNRTLDCPIGCGVLTNNGKTQLKNLGKFLRSRYGALSWFPQTDSYDYRKVYTKNTAVPRTAQSADALLRGMFTNLSAFIPMLDSQKEDLDDMLAIGSVPSWGLIMSANLTAIGAASYQEIVRQNLTTSDMAAMCDEVNQSGYCQPLLESGEPADLASLVSTIGDIAESMRTEGTLSSAPAVDENYNKMWAFRNVSFKLEMQYDPDYNPVDLKRGTPLQPLTQTMITNFYNFIAGNEAYWFREYSAHDTTVSPFASTLGLREAYAPVYGTVWILELHNTSNGYGLMCYYGEPGQTPSNLDYPSTLTYFNLSGITASGSQYSSDTEPIPLDDFARYIDSTAVPGDGTSYGGGLCYASDETKSALGCDGQAIGSCKAYRTLCPAEACSSVSRGYLASNLECMTYEDYAPKSMVAGVAVGTAFGGLFLGIALIVISQRLGWLGSAK